MSYVLPIISNLVFWAPMLRALFSGYYTRGFIYFIIPFTSGSYHACDAHASSCLFDFFFHRQLDFFFAELIIPLSALFFVYWGKYAPVERWLILGFAVALAILLYEMPTSDFLIQGIMVGVSLLIVVCYWIVYAIVNAANSNSKKCTCAFPSYDMTNLMLFLALATLSIVMFSVQNYIYWDYMYIHSLWHCLAALGQWFLLGIKPPSAMITSPLDAHLLIHKKL